jgi:hypothetical protein
MMPYVISYPVVVHKCSNPHQPPEAEGVYVLISRNAAASRSDQNRYLLDHLNYQYTVRANEEVKKV